jgi:hypothetical protein
MPTGGVVVEADDALVIVGKLELHGRAEHAVRLGAADHALFEHHVLAGNVGAGEGKDRLHAGDGVRRAADDVDDLAGAGVDPADLELIGVGMFLGGNDVGDDEILEPGALVGDALDLEADRRQRLGNRRRIGIGVEMLLEPVEGELHL